MLRELGSINDPLGENVNDRQVIEDKVRALDIEAKKYRKEVIDNTGERAVIFKMAQDYAKLCADKLRMRLGKRPVYSGGIEALEEAAESNPLTTRDKVLRWMKNNALTIGIGVVTIGFSVAQFLMTGTSHASRAIKYALDSVEHIAKKLGDAADAAARIPYEAAAAIRDGVKEVWSSLKEGTIGVWDATKKGVGIIGSGVGYVFSSTKYMAYKVGEYLAYVVKHILDGASYVLKMLSTYLLPVLLLLLLYIGYKIINYIL